MRIFIPTLGRVQSQITLSMIPTRWLPETYLVVYPSEAKAHKDLGRNVLVSDQKWPGIGHKRNFIWKHCEKIGIKQFMMLDDDLTFFVRGPKRKAESASPFSLYLATPKNMDTMFLKAKYELLINEIAQVGIAPREGWNRLPENLVKNTRVMRAMGFRTDALRAIDADFSKPKLMEDFAVTLRLLTNGHQNVVLTDYAHSQPGSNTAGGCSTVRTPEVQAQAARDLMRMFPEFVRVVPKGKKGTWGYERLDIVASWKKAYESSLL